MGLFGDKTEVDVMVDTPEAVSGQPVLARARLGNPDKKAQAARVDLLYRNTYQYDSTDSDGDTTTVSTTVDVLVASQPVPVQAGEHAVRLEVPWLAPGTAAKSIEWLVRAVVDRRHGTDAKAEAPVLVRVPAQPLETWAQTPVSWPPECRMSIDVSSRLLRPGDRIAGQITVTPTAELSTRGLRVRLRSVRYDEDSNTKEATPAEATLTAPLDLAAGQSVAVPFSLAVPPDAPPAFEAEHNRMCWYVETVLDRRMKKDLVGQLAVVVHTA